MANQASIVRSASSGQSASSSDATVFICDPKRRALISFLRDDGLGRVDLEDRTGIAILNVDLSRDKYLGDNCKSD